MTKITDISEASELLKTYCYHTPDYVAAVNRNAYMTPARRATSGTFDNSRTLRRETYVRGILISSLPALCTLSHSNFFYKWRYYPDAPDHIANANGKQVKTE